VGLFYMFVEIINGSFGGRFRELLIMLYALPLVPFFTTLLSIWRKETLQLRTINLVAWILAFLAIVPLFILQINYQVIRLWGLWLYMLAALGAIIFEFFILKELPNHE